MTLRDLLDDCLVQINAADGKELAGSGFLAAPGYVLSCAHVLDGRSAGSPVTGLRHDQPWSGTVVYASPAPAVEYDEPAVGIIWPEPDLAVIRLDDDSPHPCVRLAPGKPAVSSEMIAIGRRLPFGQEPGDFATGTLEYTGMFRYLMRLRNERFGPGMSGGPVLDLSTGEVCGLAKLAGRDQDGYAVPVTLLNGLPEDVIGDLLRAHDRYHGGNLEWSREQRPLWIARRQAETDSSLLAPESEAELLGLLARLPRPDPAVLAGWYLACAGAPLSATARPLRELRDVALELDRLMHQPDRPHPVIIFAEMLADRHPADAAELREWATAEAANQGRRDLLVAWRKKKTALADEGSAGTETDPWSVVVRIAPDSAHGSTRYTYTIWQHDRHIVQVAREDTPVPLPEIIARLKEKLHQVLGDLSGGHPIVEFFLPRELFTEPVHLWPFRNDRPLGRRYPVVIRDGDRFSNNEDREHAKSKWDWLAKQTNTPLHWLDCAGQLTSGLPTGMDLNDWFEASDTRAALGVHVPAPVHDTALEDAMDAGVRVAIWRPAACACHPAGPTPLPACPAQVFQQSASTHISPHPLHRLPAEFKQLRLTPGPLRDAAFLWDNPHRGPHQKGLA